ncbi:MAG TPA: HEAT repeat domain-containing protein [Kofleriaceae bacterium]|nr:HEAT repeat domain-containing protein [Kofleriaceae bacterium]
MRAALVVALVACGHAAPPPPLATPALPRLPPAQPLDPSVRGATYLAAVGLQLQPGWEQFLEDCRLRLPASHPLNQLALAATAELVVDRRGAVVGVTLAGSGNADFDRAVREAIGDAAPLAAPPAELLGDDDRVHLRWLFARDRRRAGPATASVVAFELPLAQVLERWIAAGELGRAARRLATAPRDDAAIAKLMIAALREALGSADAAVRRAAVDAIARAHAVELAPDVRALLGVTSDTELRLTATAASAALGDRDAAPVLLALLPADLPEHARLALAETRALVALGHAGEAAAALRAALDRAGPPNPIALQAMALMPVPELAPRLAGWLARGDARTRAAVCAALAGVAPDLASWRAVARGLGDADATVRATCIDAAVGQGRHGAPPDAIARVHRLARDRDRTVRARAIAAIAELDPAHLDTAADDPAGEVRAALAAALATARPPHGDADLRALADDRDPDVRAAAWTGLGDPALAARAARDPASQVRRAALHALADDAVLARLAVADDDPEVRSDALVVLAAHRGRGAITADLLEHFAAAPPGSAERVRVALAWLLAR